MNCQLIVQILLSILIVHYFLVTYGFTHENFNLNNNNLNHLNNKDNHMLNNDQSGFITNNVINNPNFESSLYTNNENIGINYYNDDTSSKISPTISVEQELYDYAINNSTNANHPPNVEKYENNDVKPNNYYPHDTTHNVGKSLVSTYSNTGITSTNATNKSHDDWSIQDFYKPNPSKPTANIDNNYQVESSFPNNNEDYENVSNIINESSKQFSQNHRNNVDNSNNRWVYNNDNVMNGDELFNNISGYDMSDDNQYASFNSNTQEDSKDFLIGPGMTSVDN